LWRVGLKVVLLLHVGMVRNRAVWSSRFIVLALHCYWSCRIIVEMSVRNGCKIIVSVRI